MKRQAATISAALAFAGLVGVTAAWVSSSSHWRIAQVKQWLTTPQLDRVDLGDGKTVDELVLCNPMGLALTSSLELLVSDRGRGRSGRVVWRISADGTGTIAAGTGKMGPANSKRAETINFSRPESMVATSGGSFYLSDGYHHAVFLVEPQGGVSRVAGTGAAGFSGDGGLATEAKLNRPADIALDSRGNLFIADVRSHRIRKVDRRGLIATVAGTGTPGFSPDGTLATMAQLNTPWGLAIDHEDRLLIADTENHRVRRVNHDGRLVTIAGSGRVGFGGDGSLATQASLNMPEALAFGNDGMLFIGDEFNHAVRAVSTDGRISTVIGTGHPGRTVIGVNATGASLHDPESLLVMPNGDLIITDGNNGRVLRISDGLVQHVAGRGDISRCTSRFANLPFFRAH